MIKRIKKNIKEGITHQVIGGQEFIVDEYVTNTLTNESVFDNALKGNPACLNFIERRPDFRKGFPYKLYYGHVNGLGYIVAEDEFIEEGE